MHKFSRNKVHPTFRQFFTYATEIHSRSTRSTSNKTLSIPYYRLTKLQKVSYINELRFGMQLRRFGMQLRNHIKLCLFNDSKLNISNIYFRNTIT